MKLLLTSAGISNASIHHALVDLLGKPIAESTDLFASVRPEMVYVGVSAGSMVVTSHIGETYTHRKPPTGGDIRSEDIVLPTPQGGSINVSLTMAPGIGVVDFSLIPHLDHERFPENSLTNVERWAPRYRRRCMRLTIRPR